MRRTVDFMFFWFCFSFRHYKKVALGNQKLEVKHASKNTWPVVGFYLMLVLKSVVLLTLMKIKH